MECVCAAWTWKDLQVREPSFQDSLDPTRAMLCVSWQFQHVCNMYKMPTPRLLSCICQGIKKNGLYYPSDVWGQDTGSVKVLPVKIEKYVSVWQRL